MLYTIRENSGIEWEVNHASNDKTNEVAFWVNITMIKEREMRRKNSRAVKKHHE